MTEIKCKKCGQVRVRIKGDFSMKISDLCYWCQVGERFKREKND